MPNKFPLKHPLTFGKKTVDSLTFRDHTTAGDYLAFDQRGGVAQRHALIASLTGTDVSLVEQLHGVDYRRAEKIADKMIDDDAKIADEDGEGDPEKSKSILDLRGAADERDASAAASDQGDAAA